MQHAPLAVDWLVEFFMFYVVACAGHSGSTLTMKNKIAELDAVMSRLLSRAATSAHSFTTSFLPSVSRPHNSDTFKKPSTWNRRDGYHRRFCLRP